MSFDRKEVKKAKKLSELLQRSHRSCSMGMYRLLLELADAEELTTLAVDRRCQRAGMQNPRKTRALALSQQWVKTKVDPDGGLLWSLTPFGNEVVAGLLKRIELAQEQAEED